MYTTQFPRSLFENESLGIRHQALVVSLSVRPCALDHRLACASALPLRARRRLGRVCPNRIRCAKPRGGSFAHLINTPQENAVAGLVATDSCCSCPLRGQPGTGRAPSPRWSCAAKFACPLAAQKTSATVVVRPGGQHFWALKTDTSAAELIPDKAPTAACLRSLRNRCD
jgi:hypothetical protein